MNTCDAIAVLHARQVLDSRGQPTVEVEVRCAGGAVGRALVPSGASTGRHEALELRDGDPGHYAGKGVRKAVANAMQTASTLVGLPASAQAEIDGKLRALDGTPDKSGLGANAILGVSLACAHAAAAARGQPLWQYLDTSGNARMPLPMVNLISGGLHAGRNVEMQDFLLVPIAARTYSEALELAVTVYRALAATLTEHGYEGVLVGDEGGFGPKLRKNEHALDLIMAAFARAGCLPGKDVAIALDVASTHFYEGGRYQFQAHALEAGAFAELLCAWVDKYPICSIEDGMAEDDWAGWKILTESSARACSSSAMTSSSPTRRVCGKASTRGSPTASSSR